MAYTGRINLKRFVEFCNARSKQRLLEIQGNPDPSAESALGCWAGVGGVMCAVATLEQLAGGGDWDHHTAELFLETSRKHVALFKGSRAFGILGGRIGVLLCAHFVARSTGQTDHLGWIEEAACDLEQTLTRNPPKGRDFGNGLAGIICGLIWLRKKNGAISHDGIVALAKLLLSNFERYPNGISFHDPAFPRNGPICGIAHGMSGAAVAALELGLYLESELCLKLAERLLACEATFKDPELLWPDFRQSDDPVKNAASRRTGYMWCAGTVGIGMSYKYVAARTGQPDWKSPYRHTIHDTCRRLSQRAGHEYCLCHGTGGGLALLCSDSAMLESGPGIVSTLIDRAEIIVENAADHWDRTEKHFRGLVTSPVRQYSQLSYFLGVSGLAVVAVKARMNHPQSELLLPFTLTC